MPGLLTLPQSYLRRAMADHQRSIERITSGKRINRAADDPAGLAVAEALTARARSAAVARRNVTDGRSLLQTVEGSANEVVNLLKRLRELAVQGASETLEHGERAYLDQERDQLTDEIDRIAGSTEIFGKVWPNGGGLTVSVQAGPDQGDTIDLTVGDMQSTTLGVDSLDFTTAAGAGAALGTIDAAMDVMNRQRSQLGASMNRLDVAERLSEQQELAHTAAAGRIMDVDMAMEVAEMAKAAMRVQTSIAAMMKIQEANRTMMSALLG